MPDGTAISGLLGFRERLTSEAAEKLAKQAPGLPVTVGFDMDRVVGRVTGAEATADGVLVEIALTDGCESLGWISRSRLAPGGPVRDGEMHLCEVSIVEDRGGG